MLRGVILIASCSALYEEGEEEESFLTIKRVAPTQSLSLGKSTVFDGAAGLYSNDEGNENIPKVGTNPLLI